MSTKSKKAPRKRKKRSKRGGLRPGAGRRTNAARIALDLHQHLSETQCGEGSSVYEAAKALRGGMARAASDDPELAARAETAADAARVSAYRTKTAPSQRYEVRPDGGITSLDRKPAPPCRCRAYAHPHQHCEKRGCAAISVAEAADPWPIEDRVWGYPEPKTWHCEVHRMIKKPCVGVLDQRCGSLIEAYVSQQIVRCPSCQKKADKVAGIEEDKRLRPSVPVQEPDRKPE